MIKAIALAFGLAVLYIIYQEYGGQVTQGTGILSNLSGGNLGASDIAIYAANAGFSGADLITAIAVALAESSGNPNAYNPEKAAGAPVNKGSYGLWQIYLNAHPEYANVNLYDPQTNANAAYAIYSARGGNFGAWSTFVSGAYLSYVGDAQGAINA